VKRLIGSSPQEFVLVGAAAYAVLRTLPAVLVVRGTNNALLGARVITLVAFGWVVVLLVAAVKRRQRTASQATVDFLAAIGLGYFLSVIATTPQRVRLDPSQSLRAVMPVLLIALPVGLAIVGLFARGIIGFFRRKDTPGQVSAPPA
jgi:hypothetical protein